MHAYSGTWYMCTRYFKVELYYSWQRIKILRSWQRVLYFHLFKNNQHQFPNPSIWEQPWRHYSLWCVIGHWKVLFNCCHLLVLEIAFFLLFFLCMTLVIAVINQRHFHSSNYGVHWMFDPDLAAWEQNILHSYSFSLSLTIVGLSGYNYQPQLFFN